MIDKMKSSEIKFKVTVDENHLPTNIVWEAADAGEKSNCKSVMMAIWDEKEQSTLRIDLWTKDMMVDEMKTFYHQNMVSLTETFARATGDSATANKIKDFLKGIGEEIGVLK
jgi:gliding motility-associated protein GldC